MKQKVQYHNYEKNSGGHQPKNKRKTRIKERKDKS